MGGAPSAGAGPERMWEVWAGGPSPSRMTEAQVRDALLARTLAVNATGRPEGGTEWKLLEDLPEFAPASPGLGFLRTAPSATQVAGLLTVHATPQALLAYAAGARANPAFRRWGFFLPVLDPRARAARVANAKLFQVWPGWYVTCVIASPLLKPGVPPVLYVAAVNLSGKADRQTLHPASFRVPSGAEALLTFDLPANHWTARRVDLPPPDRPGEHDLAFRSTTTGRKVAKAAAVGIATLGMVLYKPGHHGFTLRYRSLDAGYAASLAPWEEHAVRALQKNFDDGHADRLVSPAGEAFPRDAVLGRYRAFLADRPDLTDRIARASAPGSQATPEQALASVTSQFLALEYPPGTAFPRATNA